jgi:hypothetical protein
LEFFFKSDTVLPDTGQVRIWDEEKYFRYVAAAEKTVISVDFLKVYTADGVDHYSAENNLPTVFNYTTNRFTFEAPIVFCQGNYSIVPRYSNLSYDPNLGALFSSGITSSSPSLTPSKSKSSIHPAAIAVPVALAAIVMAAGAFYAFVIRPKRFKAASGE